MGLKLFNTEGKKLQDFAPIEPGIVKFYHCGPTVYWVQHIGNLRGMTMADLIRRTLIYVGYSVEFARNYTDVGHLVSDGDEGEDKMEKGAKREGLSPKQIAEKYIKVFEEDTSALNILEPTFKPKATDYVEQMIDLVIVLLEKNIAYSTPKAIYFDTSKAKDYTRLSGQKMEFNEQGAGVGDVTDNEKRNPADFALWFFRTGPHKNAIQWWESPFESIEVEKGAGFPGWHIECSAMSKDLLGDTIDIHMGGIEHIPVHHTNEIAQSEAVTGKKFVNYWLHNEHLNVDGRKMAKSEGTGYTLEQVKQKGYDPMDLRYFFLQAHYRSKQNFTWESLSAAKTARERLVKQLIDMEMSVGTLNEEYKAKFIVQISNDFNIPGALALVWDLIKDPKISTSDKLASIFDFDKVLGLRLRESVERYEEPGEILITPEIQELLAQRQKARENKDWKKSDEIRDIIAKDFGYSVVDEKGIQKLVKIS